MAQQDAGALRLLYEATSPKLFGLVLRILRDRAESEDVLQDVYLTVWRRAYSFNPLRASPTTWLSVIARNRAIDRLRSRDPLARTEPIEAAYDLADHGPSPSAALERKQELARLDGCLSALDDRSAWIIRTAFFEGETYEALARRMGAPLPTVKSLARRGLLRMRNAMQQ